jgi:hypothetical protein
MPLMDDKISAGAVYTSTVQDKFPLQRTTRHVYSSEVPCYCVILYLPVYKHAAENANCKVWS